jgi:hypothetical protein
LQDRVASSVVSAIERRLRMSEIERAVRNSWREGGLDDSQGDSPAPAPPDRGLGRPGILMADAGPIDSLLDIIELIERIERGRSRVR